MAEMKTKENNASVTKFLHSIQDQQKKADSKELVKIFTEVTGLKPKLWGESIVGFGTYHYIYASKRERDWPLTGFSPRKQTISIYIMPGFENYGKLLEKLGKYKLSKGSCLYIKKLEDISIPVLKKLIKISVADIKKRYP